MSTTVTGLNPKAAEALLSMGYATPQDFSASEVNDGTVTVTWYAETPMPTSAEIDAAVPGASAAIGTVKAQAAKATAIAGINRGPNKDGIAVDRALVSVAKLAIDELNLHSAKMKEILDVMRTGTSLADIKAKALAIVDPPQRTYQQGYNAVIANIESTAE